MLRSSTMPFHPLRGFTLIELLVVVALMAILAGVIFPMMQTSRSQDTLGKAEQRIKQISVATFAFYDAQGAWPDNFAQLQQLNPAFKAKLVNDEPVEGSKFRSKSYENAIEVSSEPANPMRITQKLSITLDADAVTAFKDGGALPEIRHTTDKAAAEENAIRTQLIFDSFFDSVACACDCNESETHEAIDASLKSATTREEAWALIDQNDDGYIAKNEVFNQPWDTIPLYGQCLQSFVNFADVALEIEDDENPIVQVADQGRWHHLLVGTLRSQLLQVPTTNETHNNLINQHETLDRIGDSLQRAELLEAIGNVERFQLKMDTLVAADVVSGEQGRLTLDTAGLLYAVLVRKLEKVPESEWQPPESAPLHVDWTAPPDPQATGSEDDPFHDVAVALQYADEREFQAVEIIVHPGIYGGALEITRHTRIESAEGRDTVLLIGSLLNEGPFDLDLVDLWLTSDDEIPGVLRVNHSDASTFLENVRFDKALGFAIHQSGGEFRCHQLRVDRTDAYSIDVGVAVQFDRGAKVELNDVETSANQTAALLISDNDTEVRAMRLDIRGTRGNPFAIDRIQEQINGNADYEPNVIQPNTHAVDIRGGAYFDGEFVNIVDNEYVGLLVHGHARASLSDAEITQTHSPRQLRDHNYSWNVVVSSATGAGTRLDMTDFIVNNADVGVYVTGNQARAVLRGTVDRYSAISRCRLGVYAKGYGSLKPTVDLDRIIISHCVLGIGTFSADLILGDVVFEHNETSGGGALPVPEVAPPVPAEALE